MSTEDNKRLARRFIEEMVNTGDVRLMGELVAPECVETNGVIRVPSGIEGMAEHVRAVREVYPDLHVTVERQVAEGEWVVTQVTARGTHLGTWLNIKPTGREVVISGVNVDRFVDGRMVEHGGAANMLEALLEVGAVRVVSE